MIQEIQFSGVTAQPSDYQSPDGALTTAINLIPEDGQLNPVLPPKQMAKLPSDASANVVYIHKTIQYTNYIVDFTYSGTEKLSCVIRLDDITIGVLNKDMFYTFEQGELLKDINMVGNTLIVNTTKGMHYLLWKDGKYNSLGQHIPELPLSFSLYGEAGTSESGSIDCTVMTMPVSNYIPQLGETKMFNNDGFERSVSDSVLGAVNKFRNERYEVNGKFIMPFFVRYAFRLFDGSLTMHSSPVLMVTNSGTCPQAVVTGYSLISDNLLRSISYQIKAMLFDLEYMCINETYKSRLEKWSDIVSSVEIYISAPIYTYDQSGIVKGLSCYNADHGGYSISKFRKDNVSGATDESYYFKRYVSPHITNDYGQSSGRMDNAGKLEFILPAFEDSVVENNISECCNFYLLKSIDISEIATERTKIKIDKGYLSSLTSRTRMTDDYDSHDSLQASVNHVYNSRLHLGNVNKILACPLSAYAYAGYSNNCKKYNPDTNSYGATLLNSSYKIFVHIHQTEGDVVVECKEQNATLANKDDFPFIYFYYPNSNAFQITILAYDSSRDLGEPTIYSLPLKKHDFLNGSYYFNGWNNTPSTIEDIPTEINRPIPLPNKLYVSEVGNPFFFPVTSINTIGSGELIGISSASKALSQGQFGQFPLYAFCTDGVWALSVNSTGGYSTVQPITRDVCTSKESITSTDSEVLFATDRGIMLLSGSSASCISDAINTKHQFNVLGLPGMEKLHDEILGHEKDGCLPMAPFLVFIKGCRMLYDYVHQRILLFNPAYTYSYIFSLKSKQWGIMKSNISSALNSYPDALAMTNKFALVTFNEFGKDEEKCMLVTRPFKLGNPDMLKTIHSLFIRGQFSNKDACAVLYGTRDMEHWHLVGSSWNHKLRYLRGSGYKAFIIASVATLTEAKTLTGATVEFTPRQTNKLL